MAIVLRDKDTTEQKFVISDNAGTVGLSTYVCAFTAPFPCTIQKIKLVPIGISGSPQITAQIHRFIVGSGVTIIPDIAASQAYLDYTTSGLVGLSLATTGSSLLDMQAGDVLELVGMVGSAAFTTVHYSIQGIATQDIRSWF